MSDTTRWIVALVAGVLVVCLVIWARGSEHHHGIQVGSLGAPVGVSGMET
jgi:hypothetical protein